MAHHIVFVHGIGSISSKIIADFQSKMNNQKLSQNIIIHTCIWKDIVAKEEEKLHKMLDDYFKSKARTKDMIDNYITLQLKSYWFGYLGDVVGYLSTKGEQIRQRLANKIIAISKTDKNARISLVSFSLGSVIVYDLLSDPEFFKKLKPMKLVNFFSFGSPLGLFRIRGRPRKLFLSGKWINLFDKRDIIASPLEPFYYGVNDVELKLKSNPLMAHIRYFDDLRVIRLICETIN